MAQILVRQIEDDVMERLKARAKANQRSTEAEVRTILAEAVSPAQQTRRSIMSLVGAGVRPGEKGRTTEEIVEYVRKLRGEWDR